MANTTLLDRRNFYINGAWVAPASPLDSHFINPSTEEVCACLAIAGAEEVLRTTAGLVPRTQRAGGSSATSSLGYPLTVASRPIGPARRLGRTGWRACAAQARPPPEPIGRRPRYPGRPRVHPRGRDLGGSRVASATATAANAAAARNVSPSTVPVNSACAVRAASAYPGSLIAGRVSPPRSWPNR